MGEKGRLGEQFAARLLESKGYRVMARNFRSRRGEVDIVACKERTVVFVEVKSWDAYPVESLEHSITAGKRRKIQDAARWYLYGHPELRGYGVRFDLIFVHGNLSEANHFENAFGEDAFGADAVGGVSEPW
jgi:putative endonuclease